MVAYLYSGGIYTTLSDPNGYTVTNTAPAPAVGWLWASVVLGLLSTARRMA
ncbi:MAG: hypothetical protein ABSB19_09250 [Methylomonas sp.]|jgi:hypothetical protein